MLAIVHCCDIITTPLLKKLDLSRVVKMLRSYLFDLLPRFKGLKYLILGSGSGGVSNVYHQKFLTAVQAMAYLQYFSLTYDCTDEIIHALAQNNAKTLKVLDVEYSTLVTDNSLNDIILLKQLLQLHIFHTGISLAGKARLILNLKQLKVLVRGDFLCDALDFIAEEMDLDIFGMQCKILPIYTYLFQM